MAGAWEGVGEEEYGLQWDVDRVDLDFKTVAELEALLAERGLALDYQLFHQTDQIDAELRQELHEWGEAAATSLPALATSSHVPGRPPDPGPSSLPSFSSFSSLPSLPSISMEEMPSVSSTNNTSSVDAFSLTPLPKQQQEAVSESFFSSNQVHIFTGFLTGLLLLLIIATVVILIRCKTAFKQRCQDSGLPQRSTYVKSSLSLDDNSRFVVNLRAGDDSRPLDTRVEVGGDGHHVSLSHCSSISQLANSPIYSPAPASPGPGSPGKQGAGCPASPRPNAFSTFLPPTRTSPEGSEGDPLHTTHSASNICHQTSEEEMKKGSLSSAERDEGIESEEDIDATAFKKLILSNVCSDEVAGGRYPNPADKEDLYAKINFEAKRHGRKTGGRMNSVESPSASLCSEGNSPTLTPPSSSSTSITTSITTSARPPPHSLWSKSAEGSESECLI